MLSKCEGLISKSDLFIANNLVGDRVFKDCLIFLQHGVAENIQTKHSQITQSSATNVRSQVFHKKAHSSMSQQSQISNSDYHRSLVTTQHSKNFKQINRSSMYAAQSTSSLNGPRLEQYQQITEQSTISKYKKKKEPIYFPNLAS